MIIFTYKGQNYRRPLDWSSVPLSKALELMSIPLPENLEKLYIADESQKEKLIEESNKLGDFESVFPEYYGKIIKILTTIPQEDIDLMNGEDRSILYGDSLKKFIADLYCGNSECEKVDKFNWGKCEINENGFYKEFEKPNTYIMPNPLSKLGIEIPFAKETSVTFAESSDLRSMIKQFSEGGQFAKAANIVAILCRKKNEKYDRDKMELRAKEFEHISMDIVFSVFFYIVSACNSLEKISLICLKAEESLKGISTGIQA